MQESLKERKSPNRSHNKNQYRLKAWVKFQVHKNTELRRQSMEHFDVSEATIYRWLRVDYPSLTETGYLHKLANWFLKIGIDDNTLIEKINGN